MANRARAIEIHGSKCQICGFDFDNQYGPSLARGYIEVHHIRPLSEERELVDPETDLMPVCSNCHSMLHRKRGEVLDIEILQELVKVRWDS